MSDAEVKALVDDWYAVFVEIDERTELLKDDVMALAAAMLVSSRRQSERE